MRNTRHENLTPIHGCMYRSPEHLHPGAILSKKEAFRYANPFPNNHTKNITIIAIFYNFVSFFV